MAQTVEVRKVMASASLFIAAVAAILPVIALAGPCARLGSDEHFILWQSCNLLRRAALKLALAMALLAGVR
jgi:hypothetical protein